MSKIQIGLFGGGFGHTDCSSHLNHNKYVEWVNYGSLPISVHVDHGIYDHIDDNKGNMRYAWFAESSAIIASVIDRAKADIGQLEENYELIFTHDKRLLSLSPKMRFVLPNACPWIQDRKIHLKTKLVSMIASGKRMCPGHNYRQEWIGRLKGSVVDHYGMGFNWIAQKEQGLVDYYYSIAMENDNYPSIFCEKITDCFATGTIPIFWGTPDIGNFFNEKGIILLTDKFDPFQLSADEYYDKLEYVKENFERAMELPTAEDFLYTAYIK
jgi:hypothetical protein